MSIVLFTLLALTFTLPLIYKDKPKSDLLKGIINKDILCDGEKYPMRYRENFDRNDEFRDKLFDLKITAYPNNKYYGDSGELSGKGTITNVETNEIYEVKILANQRMDTQEVVLEDGRWIGLEACK